MLALAVRWRYVSFMSTVKQIENAIRRLPPKQLAVFREWFAAFDAEQWDRQFQTDVVTGRLDKAADAALNDLRHGRCTDR